MSGICGVLFKSAGFRPPSDAIESMCGRLSHAAGDAPAPSISTVAAGPVLLGSTSFGRHVAGTARQDLHGAPVAIAICGSFYGESDAAERTGAARAKSLLDRYIVEGPSFVERISDEVAFAIWDGRTEELIVGTDRFRIIPIFYAESNDQLVFGSRIGALLRSPIPLGVTIRPDAIVDAVGSSAIPTPKTVYREVFKLPPGHLLVNRKGRTSLRRFWTVDFLHPSRASEAELAAETRERFGRAIGSRLAADGEPERIGSFLSGGIDSSTVTGVLMQAAGRPMKSFSIGFGEAGYNEISYARIAARALGAEHFEYFVVPADVPKALPALSAAFDEPYGNASSVPTYFCAKLARDHGVDVLFAGDGGDELFGGNERYAAQRIFEYYRFLPRWLGRGVVEPGVNRLADATGWDLFVKGKKYIRRATMPAARRITSYDFFNVFPMGRLFSSEFIAEVGRDYDPGATVERLHTEAAARTELDRHLYLDLHLTISDNDLFKVTRMTEVAGVTTRFPFLDRGFAEFAMTVPASVKMRGAELRTFFKGAYAGLLPEEVRAKKKHGFGLPIAQWLQTDPALQAMMRDLVLGPRALGRGYFRKEALEELVELHRADPTSFFGTTLWNLMILELWHRDREAA